MSLWFFSPWLKWSGSDGKINPFTFTARSVKIWVCRRERRVLTEADASKQFWGRPFTPNIIIVFTAEEENATNRVLSRGKTPKKEIYDGLQAKSLICEVLSLPVCPPNLPFTLSRLWLITSKPSPVLSKRRILKYFPFYFPKSIRFHECCGDEGLALP